MKEGTCGEGRARRGPTNGRHYALLTTDGILLHFLLLLASFKNQFASELSIHRLKEGWISDPICHSVI